MTLRRFAALALTGVLTAGCGLDEPGAVQVRYTGSTPAPVGDVAGFTWAVEREPRSLDWLRGGGVPEDTVTANLCERLVRLGDNGMPEPGLAASVANPDPLTWVYRLRAGVRFHDGRELTAGDAVASLRRSAAQRGAHTFDKVAAIEATGPLEVTLRLRQPDPLLNHALTGNAGVVASAAYLAEHRDDYGSPSTSDGCSGPFRVGAWEPGSHVLLTRFEEYWDPARRARAGSVRFDFAAGPALTNALVSGRVDGAYLPSPTPIVRLARLQTGKVYFGTSAAVAALAPAPGGAFEDPLRRRALSLVLDRELIAREAYAGLAEPTEPPRTEGRGTVLAAGEWPQPGSVAPGLDEAKALLAQAGPLDREVVISGAEGLEAAAVASAVLEACQRLGLPARIGTGDPDLALVTGAPAPNDPAWARWVPVARLPNTLYLGNRLTGAPPSSSYLGQAWAARIGRSAVN